MYKMFNKRSYFCRLEFHVRFYCIVQFSLKFSCYTIIDLFYAILTQGVGTYLKSRNENIKVVLADPEVQ